MTLLHVYFLLKNQQAFQRLLEGGGGRGQSGANSGSGSVAGLSTSGGKSWTRSGTLAAVVGADVNAFDSLGRTVLHLACSSVELSSLEYVRMLLNHPATNVNIRDTESHWTALHRALYAGNVASAILLLKRSELDTSIKDFEGYTAFDLYNSTLRTTNPPPFDGGPAELYTWGINRNAALGFGNGGDRLHPDQVTIPYKDDPIARKKKTLTERFSPIEVRRVAMSRLHTVVVTSEPQDNVRLCGFGGGGRLGPNNHSQYSLVPLPDFMHTITEVALGQDHTLVLTTTGEVLSWGLNRFSQLGYAVEQPFNGRTEEPIQISPRKIGALKKELVRGIAACKTASACFTDAEVYTWGTNGGQLGYSKTATPVQVVPRKVSSIVQSVKAIAMSESAMVCLLGNGEVACVWNAGLTKINFPSQSFPSEISVYRPPQAIKGPNITKITSCDDTFAALSSNGEVFTFSISNSASSNNNLIKSQRVWALHRQFNGVKDVALGAEGSIIVCTQSGHVFVRMRNAGAKAFKFQRVPYIQRAVAVCANNTGALAALRVDHKLTGIPLTGRSLSGDIAEIQPYLSYTVSQESKDSLFNSGVDDLPFSPLVDLDDESEDSSILDDISEFARLLELLGHLKAARKAPSTVLYDEARLPHGADIFVQLSSNAEFPAHRLILAARCPLLADVLSHGTTLHDKQSSIKILVKLSVSTSHSHSHTVPRLQLTGCSPISVLIFLRYLYSDQLLAIWDRRISSPFSAHFRELGVLPAQAKLELQALARLMGLPLLSEALQSPGKRIPSPSAERDFQHIYNSDNPQSQSQSSFAARNTGTKRDTKLDPLAPDVLLHLAEDHTVSCHSAILRARCPFFAAFFGDGDWTMKRRDLWGIVGVDMGHLKWQVMRYVMRFLCGGEERLFDTLEFVESVDDILEFMFDVMAAANELLLDRLVLLCSQVILDHMSISNVCYLLTDAEHFHASALAARLQEYTAANLEMLLESTMLDDLAPPVIAGLAEYVRKEQERKAPVSRSNKLARDALEKHAEWLATQDIPGPFVPSHTHKYANTNKDSPTAKKSRLPSLGHTPMVSPTLRPQRSLRVLGGRDPAGDDLFAMDDADAVPALDLSKAEPGPSIENATKSTLVWKRTTSAPRTDLKAIMAEAENRNTPVANRKPAASVQHIPNRELLRPNWQPSGPGLSPSIGSAPSSSRQSQPPWAIAGPPITPPRTPAPNNSSLNTQRPVPIPPLAPKPTAGGPVARAGAPGLGPVISPLRQAPSGSASSSFRNVSGSASAWTLPPIPAPPAVQPSLGPSVGSGSGHAGSTSGGGSGSGTSVPSFAEIQKLQLTQGATPVKDKRSLVEIQQEEQARRAEERARQEEEAQARRVEEEFLKWWAAQEAMVQEETRGQARGQPQQGKSGKKQTQKSPKGKSGRPAEGDASSRSAPKLGVGGARSSQPNRSRKGDQEAGKKARGEMHK
ncbi:hypothetical protein BJ138DRAFT_1092865 [Hygrophoropsis aurantiaca]|uniref:Uncharacterized protein n=1 Tax=Hygrophoropsis aurantiaca TaxID=72124 RepID=A0ACB8A2X7_9AGAM|nr:hypothetical protein BJ138DRAFT_1092865 [Hygrophoropsis aurantiaca]